MFTKSTILTNEDGHDLRAKYCVYNICISQWIKITSHNYEKIKLCKTALEYNASSSPLRSSGSYISCHVKKTSKNI